MDIQVDSKDVILLMLQFCQEQHLTQTVKALQKETGVSLNIVSNVNKLKKDLIKGKWDAVFAQVCSFPAVFPLMLVFLLLSWTLSLSRCRWPSIFTSTLSTSSSRCER